MFTYKTWDICWPKSFIQVEDKWQTVTNLSPLWLFAFTKIVIDGQILSNFFTQNSLRRVGNEKKKKSGFMEDK